MKARGTWRDADVYTVGHSTRSLDELVQILRAFHIAVLVDIRTIPRSRHNPQFNGDVLRPHLGSRRIRYVHLEELGGLRRMSKESMNTAWRNASFRGFADYMQTEEFEIGLAKLRDLALPQRVALMCAEAVPWRCHRSLVADALTARGAQVDHITSAKGATRHRMTSFAVVKGTKVTYPGDDPAGEALVTRGPFNLEATVRVLQRRPSNLVDVWEPQGERYLRMLETPEGVTLVEVTNHGSIDEPDLRLKVLYGKPSTDARTLLGQTVRQMLGLDVDPEPLQQLAQAPGKLGMTVRALRGMRPPRFPGLFEAFVNVVPFQQVSLDAGVAIVGKLVGRFGKTVGYEGRDFFAAPAAPAIAEANVGALKESGLSARKADALRGVARAIESGEVTEEQLLHMTNSEAVRTMTKLRGIGPWSANLVLLRGLGRLDVFPPGDVGAARGLSKLAQLRPGSSLDRLIQRFGDHRGYLYFCSLGATLLANNLIHAVPPPHRRTKSKAEQG